MRYIIGFCLIIIGGVLTAVTELTPFITILIIGVFLFASVYDEAVFCDYIMANTNQALLRKRHYCNFLPFNFLFAFLTFGNAELKIVWKQEYFKATILSDEKFETVKIPRKEYIALRNEQRNIYSTQILSKDFMEKFYSLENIGFKRKKRRLIIVSILAAIMLTPLTEPDGYFLTIIYEVFFLPMIILWFPEYKDAKILQQAYDKALNLNSNN